MTTLMLIVTVVLGLAAPSVSMTPPPDVPEAPQHLLWRATGPAGTEVFLLGSVHALPRDAYPLPDVIEGAFDRADLVYFEVDMNDVSLLGSKMMAAGALDDGVLLGEVLDPETRAALDAHLDDAGLSLGAFEHMKPWMAALALTSIELMKAGYAPDAGLDLYFAGKAREQGKETGAFETAEVQIGLFADLDDAESRAFLRYALKDISLAAGELDRLYQAWKEGDGATLAAMLTESFVDEPDLYRRMVTERNEAWLDQVIELLEGDRPAMVVVGALHLVGSDGLIPMLERRGYRVEQQ